MSKHLRVRRRDRIFDRLSIALDKLVAWVYGRLRKTKAYFTQTPKREILIDFGCWLIFLFLVGFGPVCLALTILIYF